MNFINWNEGPIIGLELKYCERCGGLWLRLQGEHEVYCASCRRHMAEMPRATRARTSNPRLPRPDRDDIQCEYQVKSLQGVIEAEVRL